MKTCGMLFVAMSQIKHKNVENTDFFKNKNLKKKMKNSKKLEN